MNEWRGLVRGRCMMVVRPSTTQEVSAVLSVCHENGIPVTPQGGNTGMVGGAVPNGGIVLSMSRLNRIRHVDRVNATMELEAGCILENAQSAAEALDMLVPLSLASEGSCQIGGNIATNAGGTNTLRFGNLRENVLGLEVVLSDGRIWCGLRGLRKNNTGYDLKHLFIGSEGTLGVVTAAILRLVPRPTQTHTMLAALPSLDAVLTLFARMREVMGDVVLAFELIPQIGLELARRHVPGVAVPFEQAHSQYALIELAASRGSTGLRNMLEETVSGALEEGIVDDAVIAESLSQAEAIWHIRESIPEAQSREGAVIKHDVSIPLSNIVEFMERGTELVETGMPGARVVAFGHVGDGNIHFNLLQPEVMDRQSFLAHMPRINRLVHDLVAALGGSFSAEHGIGSAKTADMTLYRSAVELDMMRAVKLALDPRGLMNPGKVLPTPDTP